MLNFATMHYVLGIWFVGHDPATPVEDRMDWLGCVYQEQAGGDWIGLYRFRYHSSPEPWDANDRKSWTRFEALADTPTATLLTAMRTIASMVEYRNHTGMCEVLVRGDAGAAIRALEHQPWVHVDMVPTESGPRHRGHARDSA